MSRWSAALAAWPARMLRVGAVLVGLLSLGTLPACGPSDACGVGDGCACAFDSDCPDRRLEFCDREVRACVLRDTPLPDEDVGIDVPDSAVTPDERCDNGIDDDLDGAVDCDDPSCFGDARCEPAVFWYATTASIDGLPKVTLGATDGQPAVPLVSVDGAHITRDPAFDAQGARVAVSYADDDQVGVVIVSLRDGALAFVDTRDLLRVGSPTFGSDGEGVWLTGVVAVADEERSVIRRVRVPDGEVLAEVVAERASLSFSSVRELEGGRVIALVSERVGEAVSNVTGDLVDVDVDTGRLSPWVEGLRLTGRLQPAPGGVTLFSASLDRLVFIATDATSAEDATPIASERDSSCAALDARLAVCVRSFAAEGLSQAGDVALVDWRSGELVTRVAETPDLAEGGMASSPGTEGLEVSGVPAPLTF